MLISLIKMGASLTNESKAKHSLRVCEFSSCDVVRSLNEGTALCRLVLSKPTPHSCRISRCFLGRGECDTASELAELAGTASELAGTFWEVGNVELTSSPRTLVDLLLLI